MEQEGRQAAIRKPRKPTSGKRLQINTLLITEEPCLDLSFMSSNCFRCCRKSNRDICCVNISFDRKDIALIIA